MRYIYLRYIRGGEKIIKSEINAAEIERLQTIAERHTDATSAVNEWLKDAPNPPNNIGYILELARDIISTKSFFKGN